MAITGLSLAVLLAAQLLVVLNHDWQGANAGPVADGPNLPDTVTGTTLDTGERLQLVRVVDGLMDPVAVVAPPDDSGRLMVVERVGRIRVIKHGQLLAEPFLDIRDEVASQFIEQGLLGLAFHPRYQQNGRLFVSYTDLLSSGDTFVQEYSVAADNPDAADPSSARPRLRFDRPSVEHNGGTIAFGPDGFLYVGSGDGGFAGYTWNATAQDPTTLLGKILRIDVETATDAYRIPEDNPYFAGEAERNSPFADGPPSTAPRFPAEDRAEIWNLGLRNPWQFTFDANGNLFIPDVGQETREEVNFEPADSLGGTNYGWHLFEGSICLPDRSDEECARPMTAPVAEYGREDGDCSVSGIGVYEGSSIRPLEGSFLFGDWCSGRIWALTRTGAGKWQQRELIDTGLRVTGGGADEDGEIYVTSCTCPTGPDSTNEPAGGAVWRLASDK